MCIHMHKHIYVYIYIYIYIYAHTHTHYVLYIICIKCTDTCLQMSKDVKQTTAKARGRLTRMLPDNAVIIAINNSYH